MKGRFFTLLFYTTSALFLFDSAYSQNIGVLVASPAGLSIETHKSLQPVYENIYEVRPGDSLIKISRMFDIKPEAIKSENGLKGSKILIGQKLRIPVPASVSADRNTYKIKDDSPRSHKIYTVCPGDSLIRISRMFATNPEAIKSENSLKSSKILIGQKLRIPIPQSAGATEKVSITADAPVFSYTPSAISTVLLKRDLETDIEVTVPPRRIRLVEAGFKLVGTKYRFGGLSEKYGFDCSGLVKNLFSKFTIDLPHSSREQFKHGEKVDRDKLEEGDLVFFSSGGKTPNHVGIYVGNGQFLHAARKAEKVIVSDLDKLWYAMRYLGARRITDLWWEDKNLTTVNN
jgi:cell wall-associated NlpC family hydrolase